jgi:hypothetical protein
VRVVASYRIFDNRTLLLDITESNLSAIGLSGKSAILNYELIGDSLSISNESLTLMLVRIESSNQPSDTTDKTSSDSMLGRWQCRDQAGSLWIVNIRSEELFFIEIYAQSGTQRGIWMTGDLTGNQEALKFKVTKSDVSKYQGMELYGTVSRDGSTLDLKRKDTSETLICLRPN